MYDYRPLGNKKMQQDAKYGAQRKASSKSTALLASKSQPVYSAEVTPKPPPPPPRRKAPEAKSGEYLYHRSL